MYVLLVKEFFIKQNVYPMTLKFELRVESLNTGNL